MNKHKNVKDKEYYSAEEAMGLIDGTYNSKDWPIIEKTQNAYVMPLDVQRDVDMIDSSRFYTETNEETQELGIEGIPASPESKKNINKFK